MEEGGRGEEGGVKVELSLESGAHFHHPTEEGGGRREERGVVGRGTGRGMPQVGGILGTTGAAGI